MPAGRGESQRWSARRLLEAPFRIAFFAAAAVLALSALWWALVWLAPLAGAAQPGWEVSRPLAHSLLMSLGFMPLFFTGFVFTVGPRWLAMAEVEAKALAAPVAVALAGWIVFVCGVHLAAPLAALGLAAAASGLGAIALRFARLVVASRAPDRTHPRAIALGLGVSSLALGVGAGAVYAGREDVARAALQLGLWGGVGLVFAAAGHRMIPFFGSSVLQRLDHRRPDWLLWLYGALLAVEALSAAAEAIVGPLPRTLRGAQAGLEAAAAALLVASALRWRLSAKLRLHLRQRLPAMMHIGFSWFGIALALAAIAHGLQAAGSDGSGAALAATHALAMGFLGSTMWAMATRVSCGHTGHVQVADGFVWGLFWLLQGAALTRLLAALWPPAQGIALPLAALAWAVCGVAWALRYGRWFGLPRAAARGG